MSVNNNQNETIKEKIRKAFSLSEDSAPHEEIRSRLFDGGQVTGTNMCVLVCAMVIASVGLNMSSTAVIIGAMLISPIMGSILASAYANVSADYPMLRNFMIGFGMQIVISVTAASIYFFLRRNCRNHWTDQTGQDKHGYSWCCNCNRIDASVMYLRICHCKCKIRYAPWSGISLYNQCIFHFLGCKHYFECFENTKNQGIDRKGMENSSLENDSKYNHHCSA